MNPLHLCQSTITHFFTRLQSKGMFYKSFKKQPMGSTRVKLLNWVFMFLCAFYSFLRRFDYFSIWRSSSLQLLQWFHCTKPAILLIVHSKPKTTEWCAALIFNYKQTLKLYSLCLCTLCLPNVAFIINNKHWISFRHSRFASYLTHASLASNHARRNLRNLHA